MHIVCIKGWDSNFAVFFLEILKVTTNEAATMN